MELFLHQFLAQLSQLYIVFSLHMLVRSTKQILKFPSFYIELLNYYKMAVCSPVQTGMAGVGFLQFCNLNSFRTKFILGFSLFMGLSVPQYFNEYTSVAGFGPVHTHARWVRSSSKHIFSLYAIRATC